MWIRDREIMTREGNTITIKMLKHPRCVSLFIKTIKKCLDEQYRDIHIVLQSSVAYPNACVPISGIIQYYIRNGIQFTFDNHYNLYLKKCAFEKPYSYSDEDDLEKAYAFPLDKIYAFNSDRQTAKLSQAYTDAISKLCECEEGVLDSINWCVAEVMDNVLTHSEQHEGYIMAQLHTKTNHIAFCVYDSGTGIFNTLKDSKHHPHAEIDALTLAIQEGVGDGRGQGNGLYGLYKSVLSNNGSLSLTSGGSSIMLTDTGAINKYENLPYLSRESKQTIVDFQINLKNRISFKDIFSTIDREYIPFDPRIDNMLAEEDEFIHYDVFENTEGTGTREAGAKIRNDVINILKREKRVMILDFYNVKIVSSSFIDEFLAKMVTKIGFIRFNEIIRVANMNDNVRFLFERSLYMRINTEWEERTKETKAVYEAE